MLSRHSFAAAAAVAVLTCISAAVAAQSERRLADDKERLDSTGSGFILSNSGYIVTNHHVVEGATTLNVLIPGRDKAIPVKVVAQDVDNDLAILKADGPLGNTPIAFADPNQVKVGQDLVVLGYPLGFTLGQTVRASTGTLSSLFGPRDNPNLYQISAPIQPGNSGGPVFNKDGQLVGVVVSQFVRSDGRAQNVNFAIKGTLLSKLLQQIPEGADILRRNGKVLGAREQQIESLSKWVVQILNFRPAVTTASHEFRRAPAATTRVDLLGGKISYWVDSSKWIEVNPSKKGDRQQFVLQDKDKNAGVILGADSTPQPIETMRDNVLKQMLPNLANAEVVNQERRVVNGLEMLNVQIDGNSSEGPLSFLVQMYSGPEGSLSAAAYADRRQIAELRKDLDEALSGFEKPRNASLTSAPFLTEWSRKAIRRADSPVLIRVGARDSDVARYQKILSAYQDAAPQIFVEYIDLEKSAELAKGIGLFDIGMTEFNYKGRRLRTFIDAEIDVTKAFMRLESGPQKVYFSQVHAERDLASTDTDGYATLAGWLDANNYSLERLLPTADNKVPADAAVVVVAGPKRDFSANQITSIKQYLAGGGRLLMLLDPPASAGPALTNLVAFAREWGIDVGNAVEGPSDAVATIFSSHAATLGFREPVTFPLARAIKPVNSGPTARGAVSLMETKQSVSLGAAMRARPTSAAPSLTTTPETRMMVVGDSDFIANANLKTGWNATLFNSLLAWITEPVPPADLSK